MHLVHTRTRNGLWEGLLSIGENGDQPDLHVTHRDEQIPDVSLSEVSDQPGNWHLTFPIPTTCLTDGVETILITDADTNTPLGSYTILSGLDSDEDIRAELDLLRAELDMLKKAFRRHCRETAT